MTRDHQLNAQRSPKHANQASSSAGHGQHHNVNLNRSVPFEPFHLFSRNDASLKKAIELVESASLSRHRVCVVTIIGKEPMDESAKDRLVEAIVSRKQKRKHRRSHGRGQAGPEAVPGNGQSTNDSSILLGVEHQVTGHVNSKTGVIVMQLNSFLDPDELHDLSLLLDEISEVPGGPKHSVLSEHWPVWNQNLLKSMLILLLLSHIVVFYNSEPCLDYSMIRMFEILETLRLKSQTRIADLLESIASKQMFSQQWIRQGRVSCPRALFVCNTAHLGVRLSQTELATLKRDLEDQIYILLKKSNITSRPLSSSHGQSTTLFTLPEREDFVFIINRQDSKLPGSSQLKYDDYSTDVVSTAIDSRGEYYANLFKSMEITPNSNELSSPDTGESCTPTKDHEPLVPPKVQRDQAGSVDATVDRSAAASRLSQPLVVSTHAQQHMFGRFLSKHISDITSLASIDLDNKHQQLAAKQLSLILPRYDDFFSVLLHLKRLFFAPSEVDDDINHERSMQTQIDIRQDHSTKNWYAPDERRFVDFFDLVNIDELFSICHCKKTRLAAFDYYVRNLQSTPSVPNIVSHENSLESAKRLYINHARGPACAENLEKLIEQVERYWHSQNFSNTKNHVLDDGKDHVRPAVGRNMNRVTRTISDISPTTSSPNTLQSQPYHNRAKANSLSITRRANGIKMATCCDCGRQSNYVITPVDRKKRLERVDVHRINE